MHWTLREMIRQILERYKRSRIWRRVVNTLACLVVFCTTYALILPAITMETATNCDLVEHQHTQECYVQTVTVSVCTAAPHVHTIECEGSCNKADFLIHTHAPICFGADGTLICTLPEIPEHKHSEDCFELVEVETSVEETQPQETVPVVELHAHSEACYEVLQGALICQTPEETIHTHEAACSDAEGVLVCTVPEVTVHPHESGCYEQIQNLACGLEEGSEVIVRYETVTSEPAVQTEEKLICELNELYVHTHNDSCGDCGLLEVSKHDHDDACFQTTDVTDETYTAPLTCALGEGEEHRHDFLCYGTWRLVCEMEEHTHGLICKTDDTADVETPAQWESTFAHVELTENWAENILLIAETQLGYRESERNYAVWADETVHGYTRYGDWYGMPHADWCGMFVSFCMDYAGVEEVPLNYGVRPWIEDLSSAEVNIYRLAGEYTPNPGDMVFFDWEGDGLSDHVGFVYERIEATEEEPAKLKTIEGNSGNRVQFVTYELDDACLLGYGDIAAAQANYELKREMRHTAEFTGADYTVTVKYSDMAGIPEGAQLVVEEILPGDERYQSFLEQVEAGESETSEITYFRALDVHFALDEEEIPLNAEVQVSVTFAEAEQDDLNVVHFADDGTVDQPESTTELGETGDSTVSFNTDSFSGIAFFSTATTGGVSITADSNDVDTLQKSKITNVTAESPFLQGTLNNGSNSVIQYKAINDYKIQTGDVASIRLKFSNVPEAPGNLVFIIQAKDGDESREVKIKIPIKYTTEFLDYSVKLDGTDSQTTETGTFGNNYNIEGWSLNILQVKWSDAATTDSVAFEIDYIRIGQPEHTHRWTASGVSKPTCNNAGSTVTYTCSDSSCGEKFTVDPSSITSDIKNYANNLRTTNTIGSGVFLKDNYSSGGFTWDTQGAFESWNYYNGVMMDAFMKVGTDEMFDYVVNFYNDVLDAQGNPIGYGTGEVDSVPPALALFDLLGTTDAAAKARYETAIQYVFNELWNNQTKLGAAYGGNFLHKASWTTYQFGLDGIYMALPFLMECANALENESLAAGLLVNSDGDAVTDEEIYTFVYNRLDWVATTMYDETTGLYHHGWDGSNGNGVFWGRGIGWYAVALVDIIDMMPESYRTPLIENLKKLFNGMLRWQDAKTGMWYNVVNKDGTLSGTLDSRYEGSYENMTNYNKLETSVSAMMAYSMMKAYSKGWVDETYYAAGLRALNGIMTENYENGVVTGTYKQSSVFGADQIQSYLLHPYTEDEAKGVGALIMAAAGDHSWTSWEVTTEPTYTTPGVESRTCSKCSTIQTREITLGTPIRYEFQTVDPTQLEPGELYVIYTRPDSADPDTYTFMFSESQSMRAHTVTGTTYDTEPVNISTGQEIWSLTPEQMGTTNVADFSWCAEYPSDGIVRLALQGYDNTNYDGPEYLAMSNNFFSTWFSGGTGYINLTIDKTAETAEIGNAACVVTNKNSGNEAYLVYDSTAGSWKSVASGSGTNVYFAKVTPVYEEPEETYTFQVLGTQGPEVGKKYVIYWPTSNSTGSVDVKFLGSLVNPGKGNYSRGVIDVVDNISLLKTAGSEWTLTESQVNFDEDQPGVEQLQWTVVEIDGDLCLQSVADPSLHLKLVSTDVKGYSQVNSTAYDDQGAQYFSMNFTSSSDPSDSWYIVTTEDGSHELRFFDTQQKWQAITSGCVDDDGNEINATQIYFAEVIEEEEETETVQPSANSRFVGYEFTTLDPADLVNMNGKTVSLYIRNEGDDDTYTFAYSNTGVVPATKVENTGNVSQPITVGATWNLSTSEMGDSIDAFTWEVVVQADETNGDIWLKSVGYEHQEGQPEYLCIRENKIQTYNGTEGVTRGIGIKVNVISGTAGSTLGNTANPSYFSYDAEIGDWVSAETGTTVYFAGVTEKWVPVYQGTNHPGAVETGSPSVNTLRFYNFVEMGEEHIAALAGCKYVIRGTDEGNSGYTYTITSGDDPELHLPSDIPVGNYTITEVSAPDGYLRDVNPSRSFEVKLDEAGNKIFAGTNTIGTFLNHANGMIKADKVAEVEDYNNRTYQIMLSAESNLRLYQMNPVDVVFVVDQSNSMLFPAGLESTGQTITLYNNLGVTLIDEKATNNTKQLEALCEQKLLNKDTVYYIIADESVTSTVYALWHNGVDWMYQDASYYAKASFDNAEGYQQDDEIAVFPEVAAFSEQTKKRTVMVDGVEMEEQLKSNGGSLSYAIDDRGTLSRDIAAYGDGTSKAYTIYTATNNYNRLHYLQDSLAHAIHQLADANSENTVSLIRFTAETYHDHCVGPLVLSPDNVQTLLEAVEKIKTDGGTRQDFALKHTHDHLTGASNVTVKNSNGTTVTVDLPNYYTKAPEYTFTVLITDGAPVLSGSASSVISLGSADDVYSGTDGRMAAWEEYSADENKAEGITVYSRIKYYAEPVRDESILMTIGLGMGAVKGGAAVLEEIATAPKAVNHMILDDAEQLMDALKQLLFSSMVPREKVDLMGDITDVISDSFYAIAWVPEGQAPTDRMLLTMKDPQDTEKDWIILEPGDWITCEGQYVGPNQEDDGLFGIGQLGVNAEGDFQITWADQMLYDCQLVWVPTKDEVPAGRRIVMTEENVEVNGTPSGYGRYWFALNEGEYVYAHGEYVAFDENGNPTKSGTVPYSFVKAGMTYKIAGRYEFAEAADRAHINWSIDLDKDGVVDTNYYDVNFDANFQPYGGHGKFYVKAKEDFVGGNVIDTNKSASVTVQENDGDATEEIIGTISLETPTVNVRLLDMIENSSEVTVFLGDTINGTGNSPLDSLKYFFDSTTFDKLVGDFADKTENGDTVNYGPIMNALDPAAADDGLLEDVFYLRYAMGRDLTDDEWAALANGESIRVEYTYDDASSHGPVGYFTFKLTKTGDTADYAQHKATVACEKQHTDDGCTTPVETYTLRVTYTAYSLGQGPTAEQQRPTANQHNGDPQSADYVGPGTEVGGSEAGSTLPEGLGVVDKENVHKVHVISGQITITKEVTGGVSSEAKTFEFTLTHSDGTEIPLTIEIEAGGTTGTKTVSNLKRGTWVLTETPVLGYQLESMTVVDDGTNCYSTTAGNGRSVTFEIGDNTSDVNVIGPASSAAGTTVADNQKDTIPTAPSYTGYTGTPEGVRGAAKVTNYMMTYELPEAGGSGTILYTLGGILLIGLASILFLWYNMERRKGDWASS